MVPRRWEPISALRGILNPLTDLLLDRNTKLHDLLRELETRTGKQTTLCSAHNDSGAHDE
jgi:hypothetical protein